MFERLASLTTEYLSAFRLPRVGITDIVEIIILAVLLYQAMKWMKNTRAWAVVKGLSVVLVFLAVAVMFNMTTIIWIAKSCVTLLAVAIIVALQPEIRRLIEELGQRNIFTAIISFDSRTENGLFSDDTINEVITASFEMARARTGALIVFEQNSPLAEYEDTGIKIDALVTSQLLVNIFEHNTPLHDGAVIIRGDRVQAATCYLPLSDARNLSKDLGTRHRAGVGISEVTDSLTIIVSEETGKVSVAYAGELYRSLDVSGLREKLVMIQSKQVTDNKMKLFKGRKKKLNERETDKKS
ncbi:MAG: diadenylate cyclase CdaA [Lachnospiraceae bacterium]|nr:diadenylate cyclase CdaA [Lachnospiraceae bacterium]